MALLLTFFSYYNILKVSETKFILQMIAIPSKFKFKRATNSNKFTI